MKILKTYYQFINEASSVSVQLLIDKLQSEASSAKMRTGGTADKLPWAMTFIVNGAAIGKLQDDMAQGKFNGSEDIDSYKKQFFDAFEDNRDAHITTAIDFLIQNGLDPVAAEKLKEESKEAVEEKPEEPAPQPEPEQQDIPAPAQAVEAPAAPIENEPTGFPESKKWDQTTDELNEGWKLNQIKSELTVKKVKVVKSLAEKEFRTAFNHMRNLVRKYLV